MIQRFQIEDLVLQDASGVVFRALDTQTDQIVAVRRFFPFGADGGGLHEEEQVAYNIAVARLAGISHPALRAVIAGGCDPVDGMPFIATEWIEGKQLQAYLETGPLAPEEAAKLLTRALEVCELLSEVLAEEAVWVETDSQAIVVGAEETGRRFTFSIAPLRWLGKHDGHHGLEPIVGLTEEIMGWQGKILHDHAGRGLGGWLKWFRKNALTTTLLEARETLAASIGVEPPPPAKHLVRAATRQVVVRKVKKSSKYRSLIGASLALIALALGGAGLIHWRNSKLLAATEGVAVAEPAEPLADFEEPVEPKTSEPVAAPSKELSANDASWNAQQRTDEMTRKEQEKAVRRAEIAKQGNTFAVGDRELLLEKKNDAVYLAGKVGRVRETKAGFFLEFSNSPPDGEPRGYISKKSLSGESGIQKIKTFKGKNVRLHGKVATPTKQERPEIELTHLDAIQETK